MPKDNNNEFTFRPYFRGYDSEIGHEVDLSSLPEFPILHKDEVWDGHSDLRDELSLEERADLRRDEKVIFIHRPDIKMPVSPISPIQIIKWAARAKDARDIGYMGPTVASVNIFEDGEASRYQRQHGRDDLLAAMDVRAFSPKLVDTVVRSLLVTPGFA